MDRFDRIKDVRLLHTPNRRGVGHMYYSSSGSERHHDPHRYHPYRMSDREYVPDEFKKVKLSTFDGEMKKLQDAEA